MIQDSRIGRGSSSRPPPTVSHLRLASSVSDLIVRIDYHSSPPTYVFRDTADSGRTKHTKLLPSLQRLYLRSAGPGIGLFRDDWNHLARYVAHQTSGNHFSLVPVGERTRICSETAKGIGGLVEEFACNRYARRPLRKRGRM